MNIFKAVKKYFLPLNRVGFYILFNYGKIKKYGKYPEKFDYEDRYQFQLKLYKKITKAFEMNLEYQGLENLPKEPHLIISNHQSFYDPFLAQQFPGKYVSIAKTGIADFPFVGWVAKSIDTIFLNREDLREAVRVNKLATSYIEQGRNMWITAEGTRSKNKDHAMNEFKPGALKCAYASKCSIVPMCIEGSWKAFGIDYIKPTIHCHILKPIPYEEYCNLTTQELAIKLQKLVQEEQDKIRLIDPVE